MKRAPRLPLLAAAVLLVAGSASAHHSFAMFDQSKATPIEGTVKEFRWTNPHIFIQLLVKSADGSDVEWSIEMTSPEHLARVGWRPGTIKAGDKVSLLIHTMRDGSAGGQFISGSGPDGPFPGSPAPQGLAK
jgi:Family of unknown function (DUF6152)